MDFKISEKINSVITTVKMFIYVFRIIKINTTTVTPNMI